jgi:hypothetical protein
MGGFVIYFRHLLGLLWTSDQPVAKASTYTGQHNIYTKTNIHASSGIRTRDPSNQAAKIYTERPQGLAVSLIQTIKVYVQISDLIS